tara:strand:+ start:66 stop:557 length:492 start_codon:yes stop_codon:yes gene_type:complete
MNIYLIGMMGTGKSMIGKLLTEKIDYPFVDLDEKIEKSAGKSITNIFENDGEENFRKLESEQLRFYSNSIIACGGGVVLTQKNKSYIKKNGTTILLTAAMEELSHRLKDSNSRPLFSDEKSENTLKKIWIERKMDYLDTADHIIETDHKTYEEITDEIIRHLN